MATMMNERYAIEEGEEEDDVSYTSFKTISTIKTSDEEQTICEEQHNTAFTSYQTISTVRTWNEEDDTQAEDSTDSPCVSQSSVISTCRKGVTSHDYYSGLSFKRSKVDESFFNLNQMNGKFQVLMDVEEHISGSSCGSCPDPSLKQARYPMLKEEITYKLKDPAYCYTVVDSPKDLCSLTADLTKWLSEVESCKVQKMDAMFNAAEFAVKACDKSLGCSVSQHTPCLQRKILEYFNASDGSNVPNKMGQSSPFLRADIKVFLQSNSHAKFTPRAVARIMHGIASPAFPSETWSRTHFWGRYMQIDFKLVMEAAKAELMNCVGTGVPTPH